MKIPNLFSTLLPSARQRQIECEQAHSHTNNYQYKTFSTVQRNIPVILDKKIRNSIETLLVFDRKTKPLALASQCLFALPRGPRPGGPPKVATNETTPQRGAQKAGLAAPLY
eukprot:1879930-Amphidinium_carterae.2